MRWVQMKFYGWNELTRNFDLGEKSFRKLVESECLIVLTGYAKELSKTPDGKDYEIVIAPQMVKDPENPWITVKLHGHVETDLDALKITQWKVRVENCYRLHAIGKIVQYDYKMKEIHLNIVADIDSERLGEDLFYYEDMIKAELKKIEERERMRYDIFLKKYIDILGLKTIEKDNRRECGMPIENTSKGLRNCRDNLEIPMHDNIYFYIIDGKNGIALATSGLYFRGRTKGFFSKEERIFVNWSNLVSERFKTGKKEVLFFEKPCRMSLFGKESHHLGFDVKKQTETEILNLFLDNFFKGLAGGFRSDKDIQVMDVADEF